MTNNDGTNQRQEEIRKKVVTLLEKYAHVPGKDGSALVYTIKKYDVEKAIIYFRDDPSQSYEDHLLQIVLDRMKALKTSAEFEEVKDYVFPFIKDSITIETLKNRPRNSDFGYMLCSEKEKLKTSHLISYGSEDDTLKYFIYQGLKVEVPMSIQYIDSAGNLPLVSIEKAKKTLIVFVHGMALKDRTALYWTKTSDAGDNGQDSNIKPSPAIYPEAYWSHPNHDNGIAFIGHEFFLKVLQSSAGTDTSVFEKNYFDGLEKKGVHREVYDLFDDTILTKKIYSSKDRQALSKLRYCVYRTAFCDPKNDHQAGCDVLLPEYDGHQGFLIGSMELCQIVHDWAWREKGAVNSECGYDEIIFVAHSMGGLVSRGLLTPTDAHDDHMLEETADLMNIEYSYYDRIHLMKTKEQAYEMFSTYEKKRCDKSLFIHNDWEEQIDFDLRTKFRVNWLKVLAKKSQFNLKTQDLRDLIKPQKIFDQQFSPQDEDFLFSPEVFKTQKASFLKLRKEIQTKTTKLITLATPHEGSQIGNQEGPQYWPIMSHRSALFFMRSFFVRELNDGILSPDKLFQLPKLKNFIVTGGRIEYGSPAMIMGLLKGNELSYDQPYWDGENEAYKEGIKSEDLGFFNQAGRTKFTQTIPETHKDITVNKVVEEVGWDYGVGLKDQKTTQIYVDGALTKKESYALNCDSAVRLDSALLYHYWDNLNDPRFMNPRENNAKQTYILNHADMKGVVIEKEIVEKPPKGDWKERMLNKIKNDNSNLIHNVSSFIIN